MKLYELLQKPKPYEFASSIWTDKHIASQMLSAHLNPDIDAASYSPKRRERVQSFLYDRLVLSPGKKLIDLGCGPGLYAKYFAQNSIIVTGIDISENSIEYAKKSAAEEGLNIEYLVKDYRNSFGIDCFDAAICVWEDYGVLPPKDRVTFLKNVYDSLHKGGKFALDVLSDSVWDSFNEDSSWYTSESGFFRAYPHTVLHKTWLYPKERSFCNVDVVIDDTITAYYIHQTLFTPKRITAELENAGFIVESILGGLDGMSYSDKSQQIGVVAIKR